MSELLKSNDLKVLSNSNTVVLGFLNRIKHISRIFSLIFLLVEVIKSLL